MITKEAYTNYYNQKFIQFEIVKQLYSSPHEGREMAWKDKERNVMIRHMKSYAISFLQSHWRHFDFFNRNFRIYYSLATYKNFPMLSYNPKERTIQKEEWDAKYKKSITNYDFAVDIDSRNENGSITDAIACAREVKKIYDKYELPYSLRFSGSKGFHFVIEGGYLNFNLKSVNFEKRIEKIKHVTHTIKSMLPQKIRECIDESINDDRRVLKMPYTLDNWNVVLPLSDIQFEKFHPDIVRLDNVMQNIKIMGRGTLTRNLKRMGGSPAIRRVKTFFAEMGA